MSLHMIPGFKNRIIDCDFANCDVINFHQSALLLLKQVERMMRIFAWWCVNFYSSEAFMILLTRMVLVPDS